MYDPYFKRSVWTDSEKCNVYSVSDRRDRWAGYRSHRGRGDCQNIGAWPVKGPSGVLTQGLGLEMK